MESSYFFLRVHPALSQSAYTSHHQAVDWAATSQMLSDAHTHTHTHTYIHTHTFIQRDVCVCVCVRVDWQVVIISHWGGIRLLWHYLRIFRLEIVNPNHLFILFSDYTVHRVRNKIEFLEDRDFDKLLGRLTTYATLVQFYTYFVILCCYIIFSPGQRLITIIHIQNKMFCLYNICVYCVYLLSL